MEFLIRLLVSTLFGSLIGLERQWHQRSIGLRTNALVATGSTAFALVASSASAANNPAPILSTIITGIGFLGAGVIFKEGMNVKGINTAATIWCSAAVGTLCGIGLFAQAGAVMGLVITINILFRKISLNFSQSPADTSSEMETTYRLEWLCAKRSEPALRALVLQQASANQLVIRELKSAKAGKSENRLSTELVMSGRSDPLIEGLVTRLGLEPGVHSIHWQLINTANHFE